MKVKERTRQKRCYGCKHFLAKTWRHNYCRACRKLERLKTKISKRMSELHKPKLPEPKGVLIAETLAPGETIVFKVGKPEVIKGPSAACPKCGKLKPKPEVRVMGKARDCLACYAKGAAA